jgi:hypothetical protein
MSEDNPARPLADELDRRGLAAPARLLADAHRPLAPLLADVGAALGPLTRAVGGRRGEMVARWLEGRDALDDVVQALDSREERRAGTR